MVSKYWGPRTIIFKMNSTDTEVFDTNLLSSEEKDKILNVVNYQSMEDLLQYSITKTRAKNLELHRTNNGLYNSLEDLLQVKGLNNKCLYQFYKSIITGTKNKTSKKVISGLVVTPKITDDNQKEVNTVLGIHVGQDMISWSLLSRDCEILQWQYKSFTRNRVKENLHSLLQIALPIAEKLPKADRYIMQEFGGDNFRKSPKFQQIHMEYLAMNAIILSHLATLSSKFGTAEFVANNMFIIRQNVLQKIYGLVVGNEGISTQYMLQKLMDENSGSLENKERLPSVYIRPEFQEMYNEQSPVNKEQISWSLLIALAFVELVVHERTDMRIRNLT
ncbi:PREDICTED: transcription elongation factor, mitochondrial-like isoform X2 [Dinoponera quadriceps]|uniref:Transcription elongation factor, mitochondrial-like isoform X2 n=1 Tax=Dinoponera quadriceps TaxID=609295 RepID=A0A6P3Y129_DINQU|nr:PREDICTED: transcription elongation factor, mitochondrial-like isoform X2 [Dinoponera quadriceps]